MHKFLKCSLLVLFFLSLFAFPKASARLLVSKQGDHISNQISQVSSSKLEDNDSIDELMGSEICGNGDEECLKRRLVSEVHLDYIYTQHHRP